MAEMTPEAVEAAVRDYAAGVLREGFDAPDTVVMSATEYVADDNGWDEDDVAPVAERVVVELAAGLRREQAAWPAVTDCDLLDSAFDELNAAGITARQNFTCCSNCGHSEIGDEIAADRDDGVAVRGYTFYHMQDTESAAGGGGIYLKFGAVGATGDWEVAETAVGREIFETVRRYGLRAAWSGSPRESVRVDLDWKRRLPAD